MVFPSAPGKGAGIPHATSRVTALGFNPSLIQFKLKFLALAGNCLFPLMYSLSCSANRERSMYQCLVVLIVGVFPQITQYGSTRKVVSKSRPHLSHWSTRACSYSQ